MSKLFVDEIVHQSSQGSGTITIGASGETINVVGTLQNNGAALISGITMAQQWRLTANLVGDANPISSNLEIVDTGGYGGIGSSMTESSGTFTFPSTGIYLINFNAIQQRLGTEDYVQTYILTTTDNSSYYDSASGYFGASSASALQSGITDFMFDVTNTSTHKVRFRVRQATTSNQILGSSNFNYTTMTFIRLGDT